MSATGLSQTIEKLRHFSSCAIANSIETLNLRLRNEGFTDNSIQQWSGSGSFVAYAATLRIRCSSPPPDGVDYLESTKWWDYVASIPAPRIVIIQDEDPAPGTGALIGEIHANILRALQCVGVVTNGTIRDLPALQRLGFHGHAAGVAVSHAYSHIVEIGGVNEIANLKIASGDLLHGDVHGIISIPSDAEEAIAAAAERMLEREADILRLCTPENFSINRLREAIRSFRNTSF